jgi:hypothetical protein
MLRVTDDILELRHWVEERGGRPCRQPDGRISVCFGGDPRPALPVDWGEFEIIFHGRKKVAVYDDAPGSANLFLGTADEARAYVAAADPSLSGASGPTP